MEVGNTACMQGSAESHLLMNGTEREARTTVFDISSSTPSDSNSDAVSSCRGVCTCSGVHQILPSSCIDRSRVCYRDGFITTFANVICWHSTQLSL